MKNMSVGSLFKSIGDLLARSHMTIFIVFVVAGLSTAVLFLNSILTDSTVGDGYTSPIGAGSIDQETLDRIKELHTSDEGASAIELPTGRSNPFAE